MFVARIVNGSVGEIADYRSMFPNTSFTHSGPDDDFLTQNSCMRVSTFKECDLSTHKLTASAPYIEGGTVYTVTVEAKSQEDIAAETAVKASNVRAERNAKLAASDWTQVADAPVDQAAWALYRQALRDVTGQPGFPADVQWPSQPGATL